MRTTTNSLATLVHAVTLGLVFALGGCVVVPGVHISAEDAREMDELNSGAADLIPITQSLINEMLGRKAWTVEVATYVAGCPPRPDAFIQAISDLACSEDA